MGKLFLHTRFPWIINLCSTDYHVISTVVRNQAQVPKLKPVTANNVSYFHMRMPEFQYETKGIAIMAKDARSIISF